MPKGLSVGFLLFYSPDSESEAMIGFQGAGNPLILY